MKCKPYESSLRKHAFGFPATVDLQMHLEGCASCQATLLRERDLAQAIDAEVQLSLDIEPTARRLPEMRQALEAESRRPRPVTRWLGRAGGQLRPLWLGIAGTALITVMALLLTRQQDSSPASSDTAPITTARGKEAALPAVAVTDLEGFEPVARIVLKKKEMSEW